MYEFKVQQGTVNPEPLNGYGINNNPNILYTASNYNMIPDNLLKKSIAKRIFNKGFWFYSSQSPQFMSFKI